MRIDISSRKKRTDKNEVAGIMLIALALLLLLSLVSYQSERNLIGIAGRYAGGVLFRFFRYGAYLLPLLVGYLSWKNFRGIEVEKPYLKIFGILLALLCLCTLLNFISDRAQMGGWLGDFIGDVLLSPLLGRLGAFIIITALSVIALSLVTGFSVADALESMRKSKQASRSAPRRITIPKIEKPVPAPVEIRKQEEKKEENKGERKEEKKEPPAVKTPAPTRKKLFTYTLPPLSLLEDPRPVDVSSVKGELEANAGVLEKTLQNFGVSAKVINICPGPVITRYELELAPGVKISSINSLSNDLALTLRAQTIRILAPIPGKSAVGVEIPNQSMATVYIKELFQSDRFKNSSSLLSFALGKTVSGETYVADLNEMPHLLIAGATGSGKSVSINTMIMSILYKARPDEVKFLMIDPKMVELPVYDGIGHLISPVVTEVKHAIGALKWIVQEMENRYRNFAKHVKRDIFDYNEYASGTKEVEPIPFIVIVIDELADLMAVASNQIEAIIVRLAQMSRAVGIHLVLATQRPSVNVITGIIKANLPARLAFQVISKVDSRTILDMNGAEALLGRGDMLFLPSGAPKPVRLQGGFLSVREIKNVVDYIKGQVESSYIDEVLASATKPEGVEEDREDKGLFDQALRLVRERKQASASLLKGALHISDGKASNLISLLETRGFVGPAQGTRPREIYFDRIEEYLSKEDTK